MKTLCMDSAHRHLVIVLLEDGEVKAGKALSCWKQQSETLFPAILVYVLRWQSQRFYVRENISRYIVYQPCNYMQE